MFKLTLIAFAALIAWSAYAEAIEVRKRREAPGTPAEVWALVGGFCAIKNWHPAVASCEEEKKDGKVFRTLTLKDGGAKILEEETKTGEFTYSYTILEGPLPVKDYNATLRVGPDDEPDRVEIVWTANFEANGKSDEEAKEIVEGIFEAGVAGIKKKAIAAADAKEGK
ncbi:MAG TPA: SRPBCC family protein [Methyloceanibacter sp.]|nr:SRPBCC family protein [Methyloceanibacter sp.]